MDEQKNNQSNTPAEKHMLILASLATALLVLIVGTLAWFRYARSLQTMTTVHVPALYLAGADGSSTVDIDMSDIDVINESEKYYAFSVVSKSSNGSTDQYILQLAHTHNLPFSYEIYEAEDTITGAVGVGNCGNKVTMTPLHQVINEKENTGTQYDTYGAYKGFHSAADPIYFQSETRKIDSKSKIDYYILKISWPEKGITNNKETDMVYLSVGPASGNLGGSE